MICKKISFYLCLFMIFSSYLICGQVNDEPFYLKLSGTDKYVGVAGGKIAQDTHLIVGPKNTNDNSQLFVYDAPGSQLRFYNSMNYIVGYDITTGRVKCFTYSTNEMDHPLPKYLGGGTTKVQWEFNSNMNIINKINNNIGFKVNTSNVPGAEERVELTSGPMAVWEKEPLKIPSETKCPSSDNGAATPSSGSAAQTLVFPSAPPPGPTPEEFVLDPKLRYKLFISEDGFIKRDGDRAVVVKRDEDATAFTLVKYDGKYAIQDADNKGISRCNGCSPPKNNARDSITFQNTRNKDDTWTLWTIPGAKDPIDDNAPKKECEKIYPEGSKGPESTAAKRSPAVYITSDTNCGFKIRDNTLSLADTTEKGALVFLIPVYE